MNASIHPKYFQATVTCAGCKTTFTTGSTIQAIRVDICSKCHPFFTGQKKLIDTEGRVERFERRLAQRQDQKPKKVAKPQPQVQAKADKPASAPTASHDANRPKSLREMLQEAANTTRS